MEGRVDVNKAVNTMREYRQCKDICGDVRAPERSEESTNNVRFSPDPGDGAKRVGSIERRRRSAVSVFHHNSRHFYTTMDPEAPPAACWLRGCMVSPYMYFFKCVRSRSSASPDHDKACQGVQRTTIKGGEV